MNILLIRVGADQSEGGGTWNGPVDSETGEFVYVAIPENAPVYPGLETPYNLVSASLERFSVRLPTHLEQRCMHLDPDFAHLTYGDQGERARQLRAILEPGDMIVFYAGLADCRKTGRLVYALIGTFIVDTMMLANELPVSQRASNAHSRRILKSDAEDLVILGKSGQSGRFRRCLPIGEYRERAYRVRHDLLAEWGNISVRDGYLQRSARLPRFLNPQRFLSWLKLQRPELVQANN